MILNLVDQQQKAAAVKGKFLSKVGMWRDLSSVGERERLRETNLRERRVQLAKKNTLENIVPILIELKVCIVW